MIDVGSVLHERYQLNARVGVGGMATVYDGWDLRLQRRVAVKVPHPVYAADPSFIHRFENEAHAAAGLAHPNLVSVYDVGEADGLPFIVMEFVDGGTLGDVLRQRSPLPPASVIQVGVQVADALDTAHRHGVVHRDVKPGNILLTPDGRAKLTDFGIALALGAESATRTGTILGSVQYLSPEQVRGESASPLSDIYALGIVLYEMTTGQMPFGGETPMAIAMQHLDAEPRPPRALNSALPPTMEAIVLQAMAKDPAARFASAADVATALRAVERGDDRAVMATLRTGGAAATGGNAAGWAAASTATSATGTWGQGTAPGPWAGAGSTDRTQTMVAPAPQGRARASRPRPESVAYTSPRWPVVLLALLSLLCVLGLVPLGMMAYRQVRLPSSPPRVAPSTSHLIPIPGVVAPAGPAASLDGLLLGSYPAADSSSLRRLSMDA